VKEPGTKEKTRPPNTLILKKALPVKGPYRTQSEKWNAVDIIARLNVERIRNGHPKLREKELIEWTGLTYEDISIEQSKTGFREMRLARTKLDMYEALCDIAPQLREALVQASHDITEPGKRKEFISLASQIMDKYGVATVDVSKADSQSDFNIDDAVKEALAICDELYGEKPILQKFVRKVLIGPGTTDTVSAVEIQPTGDPNAANEAGSHG